MLSHLFENNRRWAQQVTARDPHFFHSLVAYLESSLGLIDNWLRHVRDVRDRHCTHIDRGNGEDAAIDRLCEFNVIDQANHVCQTTIVQDAWRRKQPVAVHGWIYDLRDGLLRDLQCTITAAAEFDLS